MADTEIDLKPPHIGTETKIHPREEVVEDYVADFDYQALDHAIVLMSLAVTERMLRLSLEVDPVIQDMLLMRIQFLIKAYKEAS